MKAKVINKKEFTPVTIEITIESPEELTMLYHRTNISFNSVVSCIGAETKIKTKDIKSSQDCASIWSIVNQHMFDCGLKSGLYIHNDEASHDN